MSPMRILLLPLLCLVACGVTGPSRSGFLDAGIDFERDAENPDTWRWLKPDVDLTSYDSLLVDPVAWSPLAAPTPAENPDQATAQFRDIMVRDLDPYYEVMDHEGPHILRVRLALTDLVRPTDTLAGRVGMEGEILDSRTNERLGAIIDTIELDTDQSIGTAFRQWSHRMLAFMDEHHGR